MMTLLICGFPELPAFARAHVHRSSPETMLIEGSLNEAVYEHLVSEADKYLWQDDIAELFAVDSGRVSTGLRHAVELGLLKRETLDGLDRYSLATKKAVTA